MSAKSKINRSLALATGTLVVTTAVVMGAPSVAFADTDDGTRGCAAQFGWVTGYTTGETTISPPGSQLQYNWETGGVRSRVAVFTSGLSKPGGGYWWVFGDTGAAGSPYCSSAG